MSPGLFHSTPVNILPSGHSRHQGGVLVGLLGWLMFIFLVAVPVIKTIPVLNEYLIIKRSVKGAHVAAVGAEEFERSVARLLEAERVQAFGPENLEFVYDENGATRVAYAYTREVRLYGPVSLKIRFSGTAGR